MSLPQGPQLVIMYGEDAFLVKLLKDSQIVSALITLFESFFLKL